MRKIVLAIGLVSATFNSFAAPIFTCVDGSQTLAIAKDGFGGYQGRLTSKDAIVDFEGDSYDSVIKLDCVKLPGRSHFKCEDESKTYTAYIGRDGKRYVSISLKGDFGPFDSGAVAGMNCK